MNTVIAVACLISMPCAVFDADLTQFVCAYEGVEEAYCVMYEDIALVAAKVKPMFGRTQAREYKEELARAIKEKFACREAVISTDSDIFYLAKKASESNLSEEEARRLIGNALKRAGLLKEGSQDR